MGTYLASVLFRQLRGLPPYLVLQNPWIRPERNWKSKKKLAKPRFQKRKNQKRLVILIIQLNSSEVTTLSFFEDFVSQLEKTLSQTLDQIGISRFWESCKGPVHLF